ncbi:hypothetical protein [Beggiatoa leptomitoformis]|uniref:Uncharacterized protein n=1 Tax=Beggiatoa leptomitoformis TaxID=288004 RepID=A0A2N9YET9_9GAMM|nr:hypothetical protein [Beggiatoa leptomitoformis]AUI68946.1 hypothetical protein BLE401_09705 [Beggiatoa leptomitoformis]QGX03773.1 hypothetical protein AL038_14555 [Beggiatoa leptomitoformis]
MFAKLSGVFQGWLSTPLKTSLFFWLGGFFLWLFSIINWEAIDKLRFNKVLADKERYITKDWLGVWDFLRTMQESEMIVLILILTTLIVLSSAIVKALQFELLRLLEGYNWSDYGLHWFYVKKIQFYENQYQQRLNRWSELDAKVLQKQPLTSKESLIYTKLKGEIASTSDITPPMPTRLGNILRGYEQRSYKKYGLDSIICWSRLWLVLPESTQKELSATRDALDEAIQLVAWGILFFIWTIWSWFAPSIALFLICSGYLLALKAADIYGQLIEATFDVHRHLLYEALRLEMPKDPEAEKQAGLALTHYLWRGSNNKVTPVESAVD